MRARFWTILVAPMAVAACGGGADDVPERHRGSRWFHRLELRPADGMAAGAEDKLVHHLEPPAEIAPWIVETDGDVHVGPVPTFEGEGADVLNVFGDGDKRVRIPGPFDPQAFNRVVVTLLVRARAPLTVSATRGGEEVVRSDVVWSPGADGPLPLTVPLGRNRLETEPYDELVLEVGKEGGPALVFQVDLAWREYAAWLPVPGGEPDLVQIGAEGRHAVALSSERPLTCRVPREAGSRLGFSFGVAEGLVFPQQRPALEVTLSDGADHERTSRHPFGAEAWSYVEIDLDELGGGATEVEARFALRVEGESEAVCALGEVMAIRPADEPPPTVLLVTSDTHRADHLGAARLGVDVATPTIDALAARGVLFENGWSSSNVTIPSHAALLTGRHPRDTRVVDNRSSLARRAPTLAEVFRDEGYATFAAVSTRHLSDGISGLGQGFDRMAAPDAIERSGKQTVDLLARWLGEAEGKPLFVWLHLFDAHGPYAPPKPLAESYVKPGMSADDEQRALYRGEVSFVDHQLGRVLALPRFADAVVAVTADHGESLGAHGIMFAHLELYPDTVHVPLILAWPGAPAGARPKAVARQMHVGRTLLDLAGIGHADFPGTSLLAYLEDEEHDPGPVFALAAEGSSASITYEGWHLVVHLFEHHVGPGKRGRLYKRHETELFHLAEDPGCLRDVTESEKSQARRLRRILTSWLAAAGDPGWATQANLDPDQVRDLENLGYVASERRTVGERWIDPQCDCEACAAFQ